MPKIGLDKTSNNQLFAEMKKFSSQYKENDSLSQLIS